MRNQGGKKEKKNQEIGTQQPTDVEKCRVTPLLTLTVNNFHEARQGGKEGGVGEWVAGWLGGRRGGKEGQETKAGGKEARIRRRCPTDLETTLSSKHSLRL